jgi:hypothetical protein
MIEISSMGIRGPYLRARSNDVAADDGNVVIVGELGGPFGDPIMRVSWVQPVGRDRRLNGRPPGAESGRSSARLRKNCGQGMAHVVPAARPSRPRISPAGRAPAV